MPQPPRGPPQSPACFVRTHSGIGGGPSGLRGSALVPRRRSAGPRAPAAAVAHILAPPCAPGRFVFRSSNLGNPFLERKLKGEKDTQPVPRTASPSASRRARGTAKISATRGDLLLFFYPSHSRRRFVLSVQVEKSSEIRRERATLGPCYPRSCLIGSRTHPWQHKCFASSP